MRLASAPAFDVPAQDIGADPFTPVPGARRLRVLDVLVATVIVAVGGGVLANALVLQERAPAAALAQSDRPGAPGAGGDAARPVRSTSIPLPPVNAGARNGAGHNHGAPAGSLGYLAAKTSVTGMPTPLKPVSADEAAAGAIAAPRPVASQHPPLKTGPFDAPGLAGAVPRPPADLPASTRVLAVQKALARLGYGPLKVTGTMTAETRAAVQRFEHDRKLPPDGEITERLVRELGAVSGFAIN